MPFSSEAQTAEVTKIKSAAPDPFQRSALAGKSPIEVAMSPPPAEPEGDEELPVPNLDSNALKEAQARDRGQPEPRDDVEEPPSKSATEPEKKSLEVPKPPAQPEWRPKGEKAGQQWDELKSRHATETSALKAEIERTKRELQEAKAVGEAKDVEALKDELKQYKEMLRDVAIERDPEFNKRFGARQNAAVEAAKLAAGEHAGKLETLLKAPSSQWRDEQINAIIEELPQSSQRRVNAALGILEQIDVERSSEIAARRATFEDKQLQTAQQRKEAEASRTKQIMGVFDQTMKEWTDPANGHPFFIEREGDKEHNEGVAASRELAKAIFAGDMKPDDLARAAMWAATGERLLKGWQSAVSRAEKAEKALNKIRGAQPGTGRTGQPEAEEEGPGPAPGSPGYMTWLNRELKARQERDRSR